MDESTVVSSYGEPGNTSVPGATSWQQAVQYIDELPAKANSTVRLRVRNTHTLSLTHTHTEKRMVPQVWWARHPKITSDVLLRPARQKP